MSEENSSSPLDQSGSPLPPSPQRVSVVAKLNFFLVAVFGSLLMTCCVGSWFLRKFDQTVEVTDPVSVQEVLESVPMIDLPSEFKPSKAVVKDSLFGGKAQVVEWKTPGGSRIIMGTIDIPYDEEVGLLMSAGFSPGRQRCEAFL